MKNWIIYIILIFSFSTCKKYEQGPGFSLLSKRKRVIGTWHPQVVFNPNNILQIYNYQGEMSFFEDDSFREITPTYEFEGTWAFSPDNEDLLVYNPGLIKFKILRLKKNELWLLSESEEKEYHLIK